MSVPVPVCRGFSGDVLQCLFGTSLVASLNSARRNVFLVSYR